MEHDPKPAEGVDEVTPDTVEDHYKDMTDKGANVEGEGQVETRVSGDDREPA